MKELLLIAAIIYLAIGCFKLAHAISCETERAIGEYLMDKYEELD